MVPKRTCSNYNEGDASSSLLDTNSEVRLQNRPLSPLDPVWVHVPEGPGDPGGGGGPQT